MASSQHFPCQCGGFADLPYAVVFYDNAMAESFFARLEGELIKRNTFHSKAQARMAVFTWIEGWYNPR